MKMRIVVMFLSSLVSVVTLAAIDWHSGRFLTDRESAQLYGAQIGREAVPPLHADWHMFTMCDWIDECFTMNCTDLDYPDCSGYKRTRIEDTPAIGCTANTFEAECYEWGDNQGNRIKIVS